MLSVVLGDPLRAKSTGLGERKMQTAYDNGPRLDSKHTSHCTVCALPSWDKHILSTTIKEYVFFLRLYLHTLLKPFALCYTSNPRSLHIQTSVLLYFPRPKLQFQAKTNVNMDKLVKSKERGHCLYIIPVKTAQDTTFPLFGSDERDCGCLCVNININSNNNSQQ